MRPQLQALATEPLRGLRFIRLRRRLGLLHTHRDLRPLRELEPVDRSLGHFLASGHDPQFNLRRPLRPGWYMAEVQLTLPVARAMARFYLDTGSGVSEAASFGLPLRSERLAKRLLRVEQVARLRFDPMTAAGSLAVQRFQLKRVSQRFALDRMRRKLRENHPGHKAAESGLTDLGHPHAVGALWADYSRLFERGESGLMAYADWIRLCEAPSLPDVQQQLREQAGWAWRPRISILTPTFDPAPDHLRDCLDSVLAQTYPHWELCLVDDASTRPHVRRMIEDCAARDPRIRFTLRPVNGHIVAASNGALALASGDFVALLDHDDRLAPHALHAVVAALQQRPTA